MKMILLYFVMCGIQGIVTAVVLAFARRNDIEVAKQSSNLKQQAKVTKTQRKFIRHKISESNANKTEDVMIYHPGQNCPASYLTFWDAFRAK